MVDGPGGRCRKGVFPMSESDKRDKSVSVNIGGALFSILVLLVFVFIWPGPLRYQYAGRDRTVRIDRITGTSYTLTEDGWFRMDSELGATPLPDAQLKLLKATEAGSDSDSWDSFTLNLYNGSDWGVSEVTVELKSGRLTRRYRLRPAWVMEPLSSGNVSATLDDEMAERWATGKPDFLDKFVEGGKESRGNRPVPHKWNIVGAKGYPSD